MSDDRHPPSDALDALIAEMREYAKYTWPELKGDVCEDWADRLAALRAALAQAPIEELLQDLWYAVALVGDRIPVEAPDNQAILQARVHRLVKFIQGVAGTTR